MNIYINQLKESIEERLIYFRLEIDNIPQSVPLYKEIINYVNQILNKIEYNSKRLEELISLDDEKLHLRIASTFKILNKFFYKASSLLDKITKSKEFTSDSPFIKSIKDYFSELFNKSELLFLPNEGHEYSVYELSDALLYEKFIETKTSDIIIINIPRIEKNNILNHVLCAHEIGHIIFRKENIVDEILNN